MQQGRCSMFKRLCVRSSSEARGCEVLRDCEGGCIVNERLHLRFQNGLEWGSHKALVLLLVPYYSLIPSEEHQHGGRSS